MTLFSPEDIPDLCIGIDSDGNLYDMIGKRRRALPSKFYGGGWDCYCGPFCRRVMSETEAALWVAGVVAKSDE